MSKKKPRSKPGARVRTVKAPVTHLIRYDFHPIGQGLFASGFGQFGPLRTDRFNWVYDCGTASKVIKTVMADAVAGYHTTFLPKARLRPKIDLVAISHFDGDHTSGIPELLAKFRVGTLLLPYISLWRRVALAFAAGHPIGSFAMNLSVNPVETLLAASQDGIDRIVFVTDEEHPNTDIPYFPLDSDSDLADAQGQLTDTLLDTDDVDALRQAARNGNVRIAFIPNAVSLVAHDAWEFVPYNDSSFAHLIDPKFVVAVGSQAAVLLKGPAADREDALKDLKKLYDDRFGTTGPQRNRISLFLYGGPLGAGPYTALDSQLSYAPAVPKGMVARVGLMRGGVYEGAVLYTGDGFLNTKARLAELTRLITPDRLKQVGVLQVMHHGSHRNSHKRVAPAIGPSVSVFSSEPSTHKHPHGQVLRDFLRYGPVQVDRLHGLQVDGRLVIP